MINPLPLDRLMSEEDEVRFHESEEKSNAFTANLNSDKFFGLYSLEKSE